MPILIVLMFLLGISLNKKAFTDVARNPRAVLLGMFGQIIILPLLAFVVAWALKLPPVYFMGLVLVACCPGGSSSNVFSMLAKGDVAKYPSPLESKHESSAHIQRIPVSAS